MFHRFRRSKRESLLPSEDATAVADFNRPKNSQGTSSSEDLHRLHPSQTVLSTYDPLHQCDPIPNVESHLRRRSRDRRADPIGLNVIYEPETFQAIDIIFVHGLGGTSQQTWSKNRDPNLFWPREWLPFEPGISSARILSFGYNASFSSAGQNILNISDFAKELLFGMKFGMDNKSRALGIGQIPLIFVAHSMGGLVVKKAYILGQNDSNYKDIVQSTCAILFLSTPHRGTHLAETLNRILNVSVFNHSPKQYIAELKNNSGTLEDINEQFRNIAPKLQIVSFFETMPTAIGPRKMMVLEKDSSILGYPGEISKPLNADHHDVCKYISQHDSNYISVRDVLASMVGRFEKKQVLMHDRAAVEDFKRAEKLLSLSEAPDDDYDFFAELWMPGSCEWLLSDVRFNSWMEDDSPHSRILWLFGSPGTGKSVLSSFIIGHIKQMDIHCQFYFFRFGDQRKTSLNMFLRSLAYQTARDVPEYRRRIAKLFDDGLNLDKAESRVLWQKLFVSTLFKISLSKPLFWVIDALDESDSPQTLLSLFSAISKSTLPIRILFVSRRNQSLSLAFERLASSITLDNVSTEDSLTDIQFYVTKEMEYMHGSPKFKEHVTMTILEMAGGNFLWVHLVLKEIMQCHTEADIEQALTELPPGLQPLYQRMEVALARNSRPADQDLAKTILTWVACSHRTLTLAELSQALLPEYSTILDLQHTINQVCGEFVLVDSKSNVTMIHQTARDYLTKTPGLRFSILPQDAHHFMFKKCLSFLSDRNLRAKVDQVPPPPLLNYAAISWSYHLNLSAAFRDRTSLVALAKFLKGPSILTWIEVLALAGQIKILVLASKTLASFLEKRGRIDAEQSPLTHCLQEKDTIELWATDLIKVVGKFGTYLVRYPRSIYKLIPPFCPRNSIIYRQFSLKSINSAIRVTGITNSAWDDNLAKFSVGKDSQGLRIMCLDHYFAILTSAGTVILYNSTTCEETRRFSHGELVLTMCFSNGGDKLVTHGYRTTKVWNVSSALQLHSIANPVGTKALAIMFAAKNTAILTCSDDRAVRKFSLSMPEDGWREILGDSELDNNYYNSPKCVAFNPEGTQVAVAYRSFPLSVWSVDVPGLIGRCERPDNIGRNLWTGVDRVGWNPITGHVFGIYSDGCVFKWHPVEGDNQELKTVALEIQCSPDGNLLVTSGDDGTLRIWSFHHFALIYQLSCTSPVTDLAIDPDGRRIYDLRESFCNVWEPNALIRLSEADEEASETSSAIGSSSQFSLASEASAEMLEPITALAVSPRTLTYCAGSDEGILTLSKKGEEEIVVLSQTLMSVDHIVWSEDEKTLATADLSGRVTVRSMNLSISATTHRTVLQTTIKDSSIQQLLLSASSKYLLVSTFQSVSIWSLESKSLVASRTLSNSSRRWATHPRDADLLICFEFACFHMWTWADLTEIQTAPLNRKAIDIDDADSTPETSRRPSATHPFSPSECDDLVDKTFPSPDGSLMLIETSRGSDHRRRKKQFMLLNTSELATTSPSTPSSPPPILPTPLPAPIRARIETPLGFITSDVTTSVWSLPSSSAPAPADPHHTAILAFLDHDFWVCTAPLAGWAGPPPVKRHFFLPRDWLNAECLALAAVTRDGTLLCPRNGEVAVVTGGFREEWIG